MKLTQLILTPEGVAKLTPEERTFLALSGQFSNDLTILHKLLMASFKRPSDELELKANSILVGVLLKTLASKLCQGWEIVEKVFDGAQVGKADWLRANDPLQESLRQLRHYFTRPNVIADIRNQFGYHYDTEPLSSHLETVLPEGGFEMLYGDKVINFFYISSEIATWSAILGTTDDEAFATKMDAIKDEVATKSGEFFEFLNLVAQAFCTHVVNELSGVLLQQGAAQVSLVRVDDAVLPLFAAY